MDLVGILLLVPENGIEGARYLILIAYAERRPLASSLCTLIIILTFRQRSLTGGPLETVKLQHVQIWIKRPSFEALVKAVGDVCTLLLSGFSPPYKSILRSYLGFSVLPSFESVRLSPRAKHQSAFILLS